MAAVVARAVLTAGCAGVSCPQILELIGPRSLSLINIESDLPPLAVGVLCAVREPDAAGVAAVPPGVVAALLISDPVCEPSRRSEVIGAAALLVANMGVGKVETACGPWSAVVSTDDCFSLFADLAADLAVRFRFSSSAFRSASRICCFSISSAALSVSIGSICVDCVDGKGASGGSGIAENGLDC